MADLSSAVKSLLDVHHFEDAFALIRYALHVYAHIIYDALMQANRTMQLLEANTLLVAGADTSVYFTDLLGNNISGGVELLKY